MSLSNQIVPPLRRPRALVGMVHVLPTPGSPGHQGVRAARDQAVQDARTLSAAGFDAILVENMHDFPPLREDEMGPEVPAYLTAIAAAVREAVPAAMPVGLQVLFGAHRVALAVSVAAGLQFIRAEAWTYGHLSDKGWIEASAGRAVRYALAIGASDVKIWADIKKKHAGHAATADLTAPQIASTLALHGAHAAIVTGGTTGQPPTPHDLQSLHRSGLPLVVGSGLTAQNAAELAPLAHAYIVGTSIKQDGDWRKPVDVERAKDLVRAVEES